MSSGSSEVEGRAMMTRRGFLGSVAGGALVASGFGIRTARAQAFPGPTLDPTKIPKYVTPLVVPPVMPRSGKITVRGGKNIDYYAIAVRQFLQQVLPPGYPPTAVSGYGSANDAGTFNSPGFTIEAPADQPVVVRWINGLVDDNGFALPHLLPVDPTLFWANPPGGAAGRDMRPDFTGKTYVPLADFTNPGTQYTQYIGPVPISTHLHGAHAQQYSDGHPLAWFLPAARDIPPGYATTGSYYDFFRGVSPYGKLWTPGSAVLEYPNDQPATTLWYHDHTMGITRLNVQAGLAGFYLIRGGPYDQVDGRLPGPAPSWPNPPGHQGKYHEIPIVIQDRSFNADGSLFYPDSRTFFDSFAGPYIPTMVVPPGVPSDVSPIWNPRFFAETMVVNGRTWPVLPVERRRYRFRFLNGCNSRTLVLSMSNGLPFWQIGSDGGFLPSPVELPQLLMMPAERADVIVDFTDVPTGSEIILKNLGPDGPFKGMGQDPPADPETTGQVMKFVVVPRRGSEQSTPPMDLGLPQIPKPGTPTNTRQLALFAKPSQVAMYPDGSRVKPVEILLGADDKPREWADPITEKPALGATEIWEITNHVDDAHPVHIHQVQFEVLGRNTDGPQPWETGPKDTVVALPGQVTRVKMKFDLPGNYVWHCHILEHEDNEMMRPYRVG
jgi:bilirubin oxidase